MEEINKEQVKHDLEKWAKNLREAMQKINEVYDEFNAVYVEVSK